VAKAGHRRGQSLALSAPSFPDTGQRARRFLAAARSQPSPSRPLPIRNFGLCGGFLPRHDLSRPAPDRFETCSPYEVSGPADHMPSHRQKEFTGAGRFGTPPLPAAVRDERSGKLRSDTCLCRCAQSSDNRLSRATSASETPRRARARLPCTRDHQAGPISTVRHLHHPVVPGGQSLSQPLVFRCSSSGRRTRPPSGRVRQVTRKSPINGFRATARRRRPVIPVLGEHAVLWSPAVGLLIPSRARTRDRVVSAAISPTGRIVLARGRQPRPAARAILKEGPNQHNRNRQCDHDRVLTAAEAP
jgi:hypothetical protein